jgi:nitrate reductase NapA
VLSTFEHRSFELADMADLFKPQTDLAILNYIATTSSRRKVNWDFVNAHVNFNSKGVTDIGYGLRPNHPLEKAAKNAGNGKPKGDPTKISFEDFAKFVSGALHADIVSHELSGVPGRKLEALARLYADPKTKKSPPTGPWASTSMCAASGSTTSSTTSTC